MNMLLHLCCKLVQHDRLFSVLEMMRKLRVMPNAATVNTLATNFTGDRQMLEQALQAFQSDTSS